MNEEFFATRSGGIIPTGLPGGFFVYEADRDEQILFADPNVIRLYGCDTFEDFLSYVGGCFRGMVHPDDVIGISNQIQAQTVLGDNRHDYVRYRIITKQGDVKYVEDFGHILHWLNGKSFFYVFIIDVDRNEYLNRNRNSFAESEILSGNQGVDNLTGLFNMSSFYQGVQRLLSTPEGRRSEIGIVHLDIPNFKLFNERNGFNAGDELLCDLARIIGQVFGNDIASRFSDDHFVICSTAGRGDIVRKVEEVCQMMLKSPDPAKKVRIKAGIYYMDNKSTEIGLACDHARLACNSIKSRHDIYYCIYDEMLRESMRKQQYVVDNVEEAVLKEYIKVYYQPVIRVRTGEICGYEALVRWMAPSIGMLNPGEFIETLEQFHLIHLVDTYVIKKVCEDYCELKRAGEPLVPVSVNISRMDFELCDIFGELDETRREFDVPVNMIDIEITESALNDNVGYIKSECDRMQQLGYKIWLDDFGSGYSSLNTLAEYNFDVLKLDLIFLKSYDNNPKTPKLMSYIIKGSKALGLMPLCEGVETLRQYEFLKEIDCERAQGYYFGKPMPMWETREFTRNKGLKWEKSGGDY